MTAFGVYVHVPFCRERCDYCAFATYTDRDHLMERYADACILDIRRVFADADLPVPTSVFFGGGTPSRLHPETLCRVLDAIPRAPGAEVTVECNPEDADEAHLAAYRRAGVTRVSFGLQSTHAHVLAGLGRRHIPQAAEAISAAVADAGFATWNLDLILGAPAESDDDWARTLEHVLTLDHPPPHLSAYGLTVEPGTPLARDPLRHPDEDALARRYERAEAMLSAAGLPLGGDLQLVPAGTRVPAQPRLLGSGRLRRRRLGRPLAPCGHPLVERAHPRSLHRHDRVRRSPEAAREELSAGQREFEELSLSLRTPRGVPWACLERPDELDGLITRVDDRAVLTVRGRLLANEVSARIGSGILHR